MAKMMFDSARLLQKAALSVLLLIGLLGSATAFAASGKVALIHFNPTLYDTSGNVDRLDTLVAQAFQNGANIVVLPETTTSGYSITRDEVIADLGFIAPYPELDTIAALARQYNGYVFAGIAEVTEDGHVYNTVVVFGPNGLVETQHKRGMSGWHDRGVLPFDIIATPYGDIATIICSDSYLPDWVRIAALKGADIVLLPANWWGNGGQLDVWKTRARENGVWFMVANRWGVEVDTRFGVPYTYDMNDAPSAAISPRGDVQIVHRAQDSATPADRILYATFNVPNYRIGNAANPTYSLKFRESGAYAAIGNGYYRPDMGNQPVPGLPPTGVVVASSFAYRPTLFNSAVNLQRVRDLWQQAAPRPSVVVLPGRGITSQPVMSFLPGWRHQAPWSSLQSFVDGNGVQLLVTSVIEQPGIVGGRRESLLVLRAGQPPMLVPQIHDSTAGTGSGAAPITLDLPNTRVGVALGRDALFPEVVSALAKLGSDLLLVTSAVGKDASTDGESPASYFWPVPALQSAWNVGANSGLHVVASDWTGNGAAIESTYGIVGRRLTATAAAPVQSIDLDSDFVRTKYLNAYYGFDLNTLIGASSSSSERRAPSRVPVQAR